MYYLERNVVLMTYRAQHPDKRDPKDKTLEEFDRDLAIKYFSELKRQAPTKGIPWNRFTRSMLVLFANRSTAKSAKTRVKHACEYYDPVRPQLTEPEPGSFGAGDRAASEGDPTLTGEGGQDLGPPEERPDDGLGQDGGVGEAETG